MVIVFPPIWPKGLGLLPICIGDITIAMLFFGSVDVDISFSGLLPVAVVGARLLLLTLEGISIELVESEIGWLGVVALIADMPGWQELPPLFNVGYILNEEFTGVVCARGGGLSGLM